MMRRQTIGSLVAAACALYAGGALAESTPPQYAAAEHNYNTYCVQCHGVNRDGNGINSRVMSVKPRDHTDTKAMGDTPDETLFKAIKEGGLAVSKSVLMPTWGAVLDDGQVKEMVAYLRYVSKTTSK